jgi:hypothetical protein
MDWDITTNKIWGNRAYLQMLDKEENELIDYTDFVARDAEEDTVNILKEYEGRVKGIIHCFTGTEYLAKEALNLGYNISISGVVTFKNAQDLRNIVRDVVPLDRLHVETDAPFLAPVPMSCDSVISFSKFTLLG